MASQWDALLMPLLVLLLVLVLLSFQVGQLQAATTRSTKTSSGPGDFDPDLSLQLILAKLMPSLWSAGQQSATNEESAPLDGQQQQQQQLIHLQQQQQQQQDQQDQQQQQKQHHQQQLQHYEHEQRLREHQQRAYLDSLRRRHQEQASGSAESEEPGAATAAASWFAPNALPLASYQTKPLSSTGDTWPGESPAASSPVRQLISATSNGLFYPTAEQQPQQQFQAGLWPGQALLARPQPLQAPSPAPGAPASSLSGLLAFLAANKANLSNLIQLLPLIRQTLDVLPRVLRAPPAALVERTQAADPAPSDQKLAVGQVLPLIQSSSSSNQTTRADRSPQQQQQLQEHTFHRPGLLGAFAGQLADTLPGLMRNFVAGPAYDVSWPPTGPGDLPAGQQGLKNLLGSIVSKLRQVQQLRQQQQQLS